MYQSASKQLTALNRTQGIGFNDQQRDNCTAALMAKVRTAHMRPVTSMRFAVDRNGHTDVRTVGIFKGDPKNPASKIGMTDINQAANTPAERSFQQLAQHTQVLDQRR